MITIEVKKVIKIASCFTLWKLKLGTKVDRHTPEYCIRNDVYCIHCAVKEGLGMPLSPLSSGSLSHSLSLLQQPLQNLFGSGQCVCVCVFYVFCVCDLQVFVCRCVCIYMY